MLKIVVLCSCIFTTRSLPLNQPPIVYSGPSQQLNTGWKIENCSDLILRLTSKFFKKKKKKTLSITGHLKKDIPA